MSQVSVFGLACDVFCVLHRFSVAGRPIFEDLQRYEAPPATIPTITCDGPPHRNGITITRDGLPWADSVLPLQAVPKYDGMTWNTESATTHQSLASNCLSVTYLQYIPRSKIERGMYYNSHSHNNLAATKKRPSGWPATFFVFCTGFPSQVNYSNVAGPRFWAGLRHFLCSAQVFRRRSADLPNLRPTTGPLPATSPGFDSPFGAGKE